ncbi:hypothetical protein [Streptomyces sp. GC420]|uniref:hypothetical protein n=1 Tax=Streptomyces sp. GC420 TaxID=2697568 RepID=UPI001414DDB3|nr:hypothetical protein [Streptomyces sp. GC420]NBM14372.1 hypothetical protein [Streptomyces sp. GC420]
MSTGDLFRWRVRIGNILPQYRQALEAAAREEGQTLEEYVEWAANLSTDRIMGRGTGS